MVIFCGGGEFSEDEVQLGAVVEDVGVFVRDGEGFFEVGVCGGLVGCLCVSGGIWVVVVS